MPTSYNSDSNICNVTLKHQDIKDYTKFQSIKYILKKSTTFQETSYPYNHLSVVLFPIMHNFYEISQNKFKYSHQVHMYWWKANKMSTEWNAED